ncbi:MAG: beta-ketoacyl-ACP synthase II [Phycisphaerae bacterium]
MAYRRIVITGMGVVTPLGETVESFWDSLIDGKSGVRRITLFDTTGFDVHIGGECQGFDVTRYIDRKAAKRMDRFVHLAVVAAREAFQQSGLDMSRESPDRCGVIVGSGIGGLWELETQKQRLLEKGPRRVSAFTIPKIMANAAAGNISIDLGIRGLSNAVGTACASAADAMGAALAQIRLGVVDIMMTGGSEAALTPLGLASFAAMKALSAREVPPEKASCPFDESRDGFVLGEGAGILVFEALEHAQKRGARIFAEVAGYGASADAYHITQPLENGRGAAAAMRSALNDGRVNPDEIDYINAHGTSTPLGDLAETVAIKRVLGERAGNVLVSSTKSSIGHLLGASGGVELIATIMAVTNGVVPPTINLENPGAGCDLDYVPNTARDQRVRVALSNSFGFGGHNGCLVVKRFE